VIWAGTAVGAAGLLVRPDAVMVTTPSVVVESVRVTLSCFVTPGPVGTSPTSTLEALATAPVMLRLTLLALTSVDVTWTVAVRTLPLTEELTRLSPSLAVG